MNAFETHGIDHVSPSSINLWIAQPALWCAIYLMKRRPVAGPSAYRGMAIETGVEAGLFDPDMPVEECQKIAEQKFRTLTRLSSDPRIEKEHAAIAPSVAIALTELRQYGIPDAADNGERQHKIVRQITGIPVPVWGFLDFWWPQHGIIVDLKSTARTPSAISHAHARQGAFYAGFGGNTEVRFAYVSEKKIAVYALQDVATHLASLISAAQAMERFLSLSNDSEKLTRCFAPDLSSFYWSEPSARALAHEIWGPSPNDAQPVLSAA
jgi:hypothetical protein